MEIPLTRYQSMSLDQIQSSCSSSLPFSYSSPKVFNVPPKFLVAGYGFSLCRRKRKNPLGRIMCSSSLSKELKPKPKPKRESNRIDVKEVEGPVLEDIHIGKSSLRICSQIEKLVLCNRFLEAFELFEILEIQSCIRIGVRTYDALVTACIGLRSIRYVKRVFNYMINNGFQPDQYMRNRVLLMHVKCGMMVDACKLFDEMPERDLISFNTIIVGLVGSGSYLEAFQQFVMMQEEYSEFDSRTFAVMFSASAGLGSVYVGKQLHSLVVKMGIIDDVFISCTLIDMYGKCGYIEDAQLVFDGMCEKTTVGWNSLIKGYALHGYNEEALYLLHEMRDSGVYMDHFTLSIMLGICTRLAKLELTKQVHAGLIRRGFGSDTVANSALVDFYSKWGRVDAARNVFDKMPYKNLISWNSLMFGYANHGRGAEAMELFEKMLMGNMAPNHITFLAVLSACANSRLSQFGWEIFQAMNKDHRIKPRAMHYACMIELLGREGLLDEAFELVKKAPFRPTTNMWAALLNACRAQGNLDLGKIAAEKLYGMGPEKLGNYVVIFNMYNSMGKTVEAAGVLETMKNKGFRMMPACSWVEIRDQTHSFLSGDNCDAYGEAEKRQIYQKIEELMQEISGHGYVPEEKTLFSDVNENDEQVLLRHHSEKLALAYGLMKTAEWNPLQITQNHRMCNDCHKVVQYVARVTRREIVVRDASKFHHFKDGKCSCGGYW